MEIYLTSNFFQNISLKVLACYFLLMKFSFYEGKFLDILKTQLKKNCSLKAS